MQLNFMALQCPVRLWGWTRQPSTSPTTTSAPTTGASLEAWQFGQRAQTIDVRLKEIKALSSPTSSQRPLTPSLWELNLPPIYLVHVYKGISWPFDLGSDFALCQPDHYQTDFVTEVSDIYSVCVRPWHDFVRAFLHTFDYRSLDSCAS